MIRRLWLVALPASALVIALGPGCGSSGDTSSTGGDAACTPDGATVSQALALDAGTATCQACIRSSCAAAAAACSADCTCNASALAAIACIEHLEAAASPSAVAACVSSNLPDASDPALGQVGTCLASCSGACTTAPVDGGSRDAPAPPADAPADAPAAPTDAPADSPADAPVDAPADAPVDSPVDAPADASADSFVSDAPIEQPDGGPPLAVVTSAIIASVAREGALGDFDEDGKLDLAIAGADTTQAPGALIALGDAKGRFVYETTVGGMGNTPEGIAVADFDKDTHLDIAVGGFSEGPFVAFGKGDGTFKAAVSLAFAGGGGGGLMGSGDFDGDGFVDIAAGYDGGMWVLFNDKAGGFLTPVLANSQSVFNRFAVGDVDKDGVVDLGYGDNSLWLVYSHADGGPFSPNHVAGSGSDYRNVVFGDLDGNGRLDVIGSAEQGSPSPVAITLQRTNGTFMPEVGYGTSVDEPPVVTDLDGDSHLDVVASCQSTSSVVFFHGNGDGTVAAPTSYGLPSAPAFILTADVDKDGKPDVVAVHAGVYATTLLQ